MERNFSPEQRLKVEYRSRVAEALRRVRRYRGAEAEFRGLMNVLERLESWLTQQFGESCGNNLGQKENRLSTEREKMLGKLYLNGRTDRTIADLLQLTQDRFLSRLEQTSSYEAGLDVLEVELDGVLLPPGDVPIVEGRGQKVEDSEVRFHGRLRELIGLFNKNGIYTDDIIVLRGQLYPGMARQLSYVLVEVPRLNKQVLVCDQVEEATFVVHSIVARQTLMCLSKDQLQERYGARIERVIYRERAQWEAEVGEALFRDGERGARVDVRGLEGLRRAIMEQVSAPEEWAGMKSREKRAFKFGGLGFTAISTRFGVKEDPTKYHSVHLELGRKIYGEHEALEHEVLPELTNEELVEAIEKEVPTPKEWAEMKVKEKSAFKVGGLGLNAISTWFGVEENPVGNHSVHLELGRKIFGEHEVLKYEAPPELTDEELLEAIKKEISTPEKWVGMKSKEKSSFKVGGLGLTAISTRFGVEGNPAGYHSVHLELGRKIFGEHEVLKYEAPPELTDEELLEAIKQEISTPEEWVGMKAREKKAFKVGGRGLKAIARRFGLEGNPVGNHSVHLELGRRIYGEHEVLTELTGEELVGLMKEILTPERWAGMKQKEKRAFKVGGLGLTAISTRFGVEGRPIANHSVHLELGRKIYGEHEAFEYEVLPELTNEELLEAIKKEISTPETWAGMKFKEKEGFKVGGLGLNAIARRFEVEGNPIDNRSVHLELGRKIFGEHEVLKYDAPPELRNEELLEAIKQEISTPEKWVEMKYKEKKVFKVGGLGLRAIARRFGVKGSPIDNHSVHLELGREIYGEDEVFTPDSP